jgi:hypothetical protein
MLFPKEKMHVVTVYQGHTSDEGWLVLDFSKIDTEGISKIYIDLAEVERVRELKAEQTDIMKRTKDLLSLDDE